MLGTRPADRTSPSSQIATTQKSRCTSRPIARPTHLGNATSHLHNAVDSAAGEPAGQRHRPIRARSSIQASRRGGRTKSPGSKPIDQNGLPVCVLPTKAPVPDRPTLRPDPDRASTSSFMPRKAAGSAAARRGSHDTPPFRPFRERGAPASGCSERWGWAVSPRGRWLLLLALCDSLGGSDAGLNCLLGASIFGSASNIGLGIRAQHHVVVGR